MIFWSRIFSLRVGIRSQRAIVATFIKMAKSSLVSGIADCKRMVVLSGFIPTER